jgi:hypothetical protein
MENIEQIKKVLIKLNKIGESNLENNTPQIKDVKIFSEILDKNGKILKEKYNIKDKHGLKYKELLTRYLFLNAILDQGPDMEGVRRLQANVTNILYSNKIFFLHNPHTFFKNIDFVFETIKEQHEIVKNERAQLWAKLQNANPNRYNLFLDNSSQLSSYIIGRWGPPISIIQILINKRKTLLELFEEKISAEKLSEFIKSDQTYGMGKAIGNKAAHLLVKWLIYSYGLINKESLGWNQNSYELPFDSNAGRVLFMTGFFHYFFPSLNNLENQEIARQWLSTRNNQRFTKEMDGDNNWTGRYHMYITNSFRGRPIELEIKNELDKEIKEYIKNTFNLRPRRIKVQHMINYLSKKLQTKIGAIDDGLMKIGTTICINRGNQKCNKCPLNKFCSGSEDNERKNKFYT